MVLSLAAAQDGSLWIATSNGLTHMQNEHLHNYTRADGLSGDRVITVIETAVEASGLRPMGGQPPRG